MATDPEELINWIELARAEMEKYAETDAAYSEIMATCVALGEKLLPSYSSPTLHEECKDLERHIFALTEQELAKDWQAWAVWEARQGRPGRHLRVVR